MTSGPIGPSPHAGHYGAMRGVLCVLLLWSLFGIAAARAAEDVLLVIDNSGSMRKHDPHGLTRDAARAFLQGLSEETRVGIVVFDETTRLAVPLSPIADLDPADLDRSLTQLTFRGRFTDTPAAVERAIYELRQRPEPGGRPYIVLLTDGIVDTGEPAHDLERSRWLREDLAAEAHTAGIRVFAIAFTDEADFQLLQSLAQRTGGAYFRAYRAEDLAPVLTRIREAIALPEPSPAARSRATGDHPVTGLRAPPPPLGGDAAGPSTEGNTPLPPAPLPDTEEARDAPRPRPLPEPPAGASTASPAAAEESRSVGRLLVVGGALMGLISAVIGALILYHVRRSARLSHAEPVPPAIPQAFLNDLQGSSGQTAYELGERPLLIGRAQPHEDDGMEHLVIDETHVGRRHAIIEYKDYSYWVVDLNSVNGTYVNGRRVTDQIALKHGDRVRFYRAEFEFVMPELFDAGMTLMSHGVYSGEVGSDDPTLIPGRLSQATRPRTGT